MLADDVEIEQWMKSGACGLRIETIEYGDGVYPLQRVRALPSPPEIFQFLGLKMCIFGAFSSPSDGYIIHKKF